MKKLVFSSAVLSLCLGLTLGQVNAQNTVVKQSIMAKQAAYQMVDQVTPFKTSQLQHQKALKDFPQEISKALVMDYNASSVMELVQKNPQYFELALPSFDGNWVLELEPMQIFADGFKFTSPKGDVSSEIEVGSYFKGKVKGIENSVVSVSILRDEIIGVISTDEGNFNLGKLKTADKSLAKTYILYNEKQLDHLKTATCGAAEMPAGTSLKVKGVDGAKSASKCVNVYLEVDYDVYQDKGSSLQATSDFMTAVFNEIAVLYSNDNITVKISEMFIWSSSSPYSGINSSGYLNGFRSERSSFNGDIAHLVSMKSSYGGVAYVDVLCNPNYAYGWSGIKSNYSQVPTYSWTVEVMTHEMGHNLGSPHTQSCSWPGGAIDNCYQTEGGCSPGPQPTNGGTIMSYCHLTSTGINFNNGFGPLPGDLIRSKVAGASCLETCEVGEPTCDIPGNVSTSNVGQNGFSVSWNSVSSAVSYDVRYREQGVSSWNNASSGTNSYNITGLDPLTTYEVQIQSNCAEEVSGFSNSVTETTETDQVTYCSSGSTNNQYEWIAGVNIAGVNNPSGGSTYSDFTSIQINAKKGVSESLTLTPGFASSSYNEYFVVWADLNQDGDFDDAGEKLYQSGATKTAVSGSFTVPSSALLGATRLRVSMRYNQAPASCGSFTYGEVEDYTLVVEDDVQLPCETPLGLAVTNEDLTSISLSWSAASSNETGYVLQHRESGSSWNSQTVSGTSATVSGLNHSSNYDFRVRANCGSDQSSNSSIVSGSTNEPDPCLTPDGLALSGATTNSLQASWNSVSGANSYNLEHRAAGGSWSSQSVSGTSATISGLSANTSYEVRVSTVCQYGNSGVSASQSITTEDEPVVVDYCGSKGNNTNDEWIAKVTIAGFVSTSGNNGGYADFTQAGSGDLVIGQNNAFTFEPGFRSSWFSVSRYPEYWRVWVDLNGDGDFSDAGEMVYDQGGTSRYAISGNAFVPAGTAPRTTRMRISMKYNGAPSACETFTYGEVEDYTVNLVNALPSTGGITASAVTEVSLNLAPNPTSSGISTLTLQLTEDANAAQVIVMDMAGRMVTSYDVSGTAGQIVKQDVNLNAAEAGVYMVVVKMNTGQTTSKKLIKQ